MVKRVLIVEDHEEMRMLYDVFFKREQEIEIVYQAESGEEALSQIDKLRPDLIIADVSLPGMSGIELARHTSEHYPQTKILVVTGHERDRYLKSVKDAGADELVMKGDVNEIIESVKKLLDLH